jgi:UDP-glucose 4-epimerase
MLLSIDTGMSAAVLTPEAGFDGVLHFAGKIEVAESVSRPDVYWHANVQGSLALLEAVRKAGTPRLIFSSTGSMYQAEGTEKLTEDARVRPRNPYAATKLMVDVMLAGECGAFGLGAASLRYFNAAGAVGGLGERPACGTTSMCPIWPPPTCSRWRRSNLATTRCTTSAMATVTATSRWSTRCER